MSTNIKYQYAFDEDRNLVNIDEVIKENRKQNKFYCISCGKELIPRLGDIRVRHFAHKNSEEASVCNKETYLHSLGKLLIKNKFDNEKAFNISFLKYCNCHHASQCLSFSPDTCKASYLYTVNLKEYYNKCEEEKRIGDFVADVLLSSAKPDVSEILIEIRYTHACTEQKINSGYRIIEITVETEEELKKIVDSDLIESQSIVYYEFDRDGKNYLLEYTTKQIQQKFFLSEKFNISFDRTLLCQKNEQCPFYDKDYCVESKLYTYDLKKLFYHCEVCEGNNTISPLKFSKSGNPNQSPILIDLCCSAHCQIQHKSTQEQRIIRICFDSKDSFDKILSNDIVETEDKVQFLNFAKTAKNEFSSTTERSDINIFKLYANSKAHIDWEYCTCHTTERLPNKSEIFKVTFINDKHSRDEVYKMCYLLALNNNINLKSCTLCKYRKEPFSQYLSMGPNFCRMSKKYGTPAYPQSSQANECGYYSIDKQSLSMAKEQSETICHKILSARPGDYTLRTIPNATNYSTSTTSINQNSCHEVSIMSSDRTNLVPKTQSFRYIYALSGKEYIYSDYSENTFYEKRLIDNSIIELIITGTNLNTNKAKQIGFSYMLRNELIRPSCLSCINRNSNECSNISLLPNDKCYKYSKIKINSLYSIPDDVKVNLIK